MGLIPALGQAELATGTAIPGRLPRRIGDARRHDPHDLLGAERAIRSRLAGGRGPRLRAADPAVPRRRRRTTRGRRTNNAFSLLLASTPTRGGGGQLQDRLQRRRPTRSTTPTPYPAKRNQCVSPAGVATCVTDLQLQHELDRVIQAHDPSGRGLHDLWFVFLPPNVDTCISPARAGRTRSPATTRSRTSATAPTDLRADPEPADRVHARPRAGSRRAIRRRRSAIDTVAHEAVEAITDPEGTGWMDPNGFEVADKCENPADTARRSASRPTARPYNQVINGDQYLIQMMWSNVVQGCMQSVIVDASRRCRWRPSI